MQKVACPTMMVQSANSRCIGSKTVCKVVLSAIPETIPGSAIGKTTNKEIADLPKKLYLETAKATQVPSTNAIAVAPKPTLTEEVIALINPPLWPTFPHQVVDSDWGGQLKVRDGLKEFITTVISGR